MAWCDAHFYPSFESESTAARARAPPAMDPAWPADAGLDGLEGVHFALEPARLWHDMLLLASTGALRVSRNLVKRWELHARLISKELQPISYIWQLFGQLQAPFPGLVLDLKVAIFDGSLAEPARHKVGASGTACLGQLHAPFSFRAPTAHCPLPTAHCLQAHFDPAASPWCPPQQACGSGLQAASAPWCPPRCCPRAHGSRASSTWPQATWRP